MDFASRRSDSGPLNAVILDWAGTTVDFGSFAPTAVFIRLLESENVTITAEDARSGMGLMKKDHLRMILSRPAVVQAWKDVHGQAPADADVDRLFDRFVGMQLAVLASYADPIPGLLETIETLRARKIKIGSTTGYTRQMMEVLLPEAHTRGYTPDCLVCPDEVPAGRPFPWMCYENAIRMGVFPMESMVKVGDTPVDMEEGLNAGMWTVGLTLTGNLLGMNQMEVQGLSDQQRRESAERIGKQLTQAGAHLVIEGIWDLPAALDEIQARIRHGERP